MKTNILHSIGLVLLALLLAAPVTIAVVTDTEIRTDLLNEVYQIAERFAVGLAGPPWEGPVKLSMEGNDFHPEPPK